MSKSGLDFSGLADLATEKNARDWVPFGLDRLRLTGYGVFYDQSLTNTGWILVHRSPAIRFRVLDRGMINAPDLSSLTSHERDLAKGNALFMSVVGYKPGSMPIHHVGIERPPQGKYVTGDGTSSLLAAQCLTNAFLVKGWASKTTVLDARSAKKMICGNPNAKKVEAHQALRPLLSQIAGGETITNEHLRDALLIALLRYTQES